MQDKNQKESTSTDSEMSEAELDEVSGGISSPNQLADEPDGANEDANGYGMDD